jgi:uncharacterized protein (DUF362 family)
MERDIIVSIAGKQGALNNAKNALSALDLEKLRGKSVLIKPNIGRAATVGRGYNTHPLTVAGVVEIMKDAGCSRIAIGESPLVGINTMEAFDKGGITEVARKYNVELIDLDAFPFIKKDILNGRVLESTKVCSKIYEFDQIVSVPVAKTHMHTGVTLGIKNMKGCLWRHEKVRYHQLEYLHQSYPEKTLDAAISDLATIMLPDLTLIDGYIGMEGLGPSGGEAIYSDFAVASWHPMGADIFGCLLMGLNPSDIVYLRLISERMGLPLDPESYQAIPEDYSNYIVPYRVPPTKYHLSLRMFDLR